MRRVVAMAAGLLLLAATVLAGCGGGSGSSASSGSGGNGAKKTTTLDVGILGIAADAPIWIASEKGYFAQEGLKIRTHTAAGGAAIVPAVVSGSYQIGTGDLLAVISAASKGLPLKVLTKQGVPISHATAASSLTDDAHLGNGVVTNESGIKSVADLKGKTIAVATLGSINTVMASAWLQKHGVDPKSVHFLEMPFPEMPVALAKHRVDAAYVIEPFLSKMAGSGARVLGYPIADVAPDLAFAGYFAKSDYLKQHPDVIAGFDRAIERANAYVDSHEKAYRAAIVAHTKTPPAAAQHIRLRSFHPGRPDSLQVLERLGSRYGVLKQAPPVDSLKAG